MDGLTGYRQTGTGPAMARESGVTVHSRARICTPAAAARRSAAQEIANRMCAAGIRGIWNFVPLDITTSVPIENVHLSESLSTLSYKIEHGLLD